MFRKILFAALAITLALPSYAVTCAQGNPDHPAVPHAVVRYRENPNISPIKCCQDPDIGYLRVCDPDMPAGVPVRYVKCVGGSGTPGSPYTGVAEMSQAEKDAMDAYLAPDPQPLFQVTAPTGESGGIQARADEVRVGSVTPTNVFLVYDSTNYVALGAGGRMAIGFDLTQVTADDFVAINGPVRLTDIGARPTCSSALRGQLWVDFNTGGTSDQLYMCRREAGNNYVWAQVTP